jgi:hypothetical protein
MTILLKTLCCLTPLAVLTSLAAQGSRPLTPNLPQSSHPASRTANIASPYVVPDSWAYAAFDRLAALGVVQSAFAGLRPWTRMDCARLLSEIEDQQAGVGSLDDEAADAYATLAAEFRLEMERFDGNPNRGAQMESLYLRSDGIAGKPINDGFHFAQTEVNNFVRSYGEALNSYTGASVRTVYGPFAGYVRTEVQRACTEPTVPSAAQAAIGMADFTQSAELGPSFYYFNVRYLSGSTNRQLIGSWIGREGSGVELWDTWWFSPRVSLQANYGEMTSNPQFLRGGDLHDASVASDLRLAREWSIHLSGQFERWQFPPLSPTASDNMTVSAQLTWSPQPRSL